MGLKYFCIADFVNRIQKEYEKCSNPRESVERMFARCVILEKNQLCMLSLFIFCQKSVLYSPFVVVVVVMYLLYYFFFSHFLHFAIVLLPDQHSRMEVVGVAVGVVVVGVVGSVVMTTEEEEAAREAAGVALLLFVQNEVFFQYQTNALLIVLLQNRRRKKKEEEERIGQEKI